MIVRNRLLNYDDCYIFQDTEYFKFSLDSVLLANFVTINKRDKKILDLATGNAPIPMLLTYRTNAKIYGVEIQRVIYNLGIISVKENNMHNQITLINDDKYEYEPTLLSGYEGELFNSVVDPISTKTGKLHFSYPKDMGDLTDNMVIRIVSGEEEADISLKQISNVKKEIKNETQAAEEQSSAGIEEENSQNFDSSNALIGTWISDDESTSFTFNQDGTCEISCDFEYNEGTYIIDGNRLILSSGLEYTYWFENGALILKTDYFEYTCYRVVI